MKYLILISLILVGCSKSDPQPATPTSVKDLIGHYTGSFANSAVTATTISVDFNIAKSGSTYSVTGSYVISGVSKEVTQSTVIPGVTGKNAWELIINNSGLILYPGTPSTDYNTFSSSVPDCKDLPGGLSSTLTLTRK